MSTESTQSTPEIMFKPVSAARYMERLEVVFPIGLCPWGFLVGEPHSARTCSVTSQYRSTYFALIERAGRHFESLTPITIPEFRALDISKIKIVGGKQS